MCGICGIINFNKQPVCETPIRKMMQIMKHRGPDDEGVFMDKNVGLGFVRLSIIDLSKSGNQPMSSNDDRYVIVFNGEIYNYIEIRKELKLKGHVFKTNSDTEVLLAAYMEWGEECLHRFNGMWAFVIYDRFKKKLFAARDRYGIKPFYYLKTVNCLAFASEIPPLLSLLERKPSPDQQSIFDYLVFNRTDQTERTFYLEIKKLQHGDCFELSNLSLSHFVTLSPKKWYNLRDRVVTTQGFSNPTEFRELFSSAVGLRLRSDVPVGVCLSGGLDSSSIASIIAKDYPENKLKTFSVIFGKDIKTDESEYIEKIRPFAKQMKFIKPTAESLYNDMPDFIKTIGEPVPSTGPYAQYKVFELSKGSAVVLLNGQGADEMLAGYHYFFGFYFKDLFKNLRLGKLSSELIQYLVKHKNLFGIKTFIYFMLSGRLRTCIMGGERKYLNPEFVNQFKNSSHIVGNLYSGENLNDALMDHFEYKLEHLLKWEDRNSMRFSLESRLPFLDYRLVEKCLASEDQWIIQNAQTKFILKRAMSGIVPAKILARNDKIGFGAPQDIWFRTRLFRDFIFNLIQSKSFKERGFFNIGKSQNLYQNHLKNNGDFGNDIWKAINLELWFRNNID